MQKFNPQNKPSEGNYKQTHNTPMVMAMLFVLTLLSNRYISTDVYTYMQTTIASRHITQP